jgi:hypothetical protein
VIGDYVVLVVSARAKATPAKLTQHESVLGETVHKLVVIQIAQAFEFFAAHFALERRLHVTFHVTAQSVFMCEFFIANRTDKH